MRTATATAVIAALESRDRVGAPELAELCGVSVPTMRYVLFRLVAEGQIKMQKEGNYRLWFSLAHGKKEDKKT